MKETSAKQTVRFKNTNKGTNFTENNFNNLKREVIINENKEPEEANNSIHKNVESSLKAFGLSLNKSHLEYNNFINNPVRATIKINYHIGLIDRFESKNETLTTTLPVIQHGEEN